MNYLPVIVPSLIAMTRPNIQVNIIRVLVASNILSKYHTGPGCVDFVYIKSFFNMCWGIKQSLPSENYTFI